MIAPGEAPPPVPAASVAGAILAGGRASRFGGGAKGLELVAGKRIVDRVIAAMRDITSEVILVGASDQVAATLPRCRPVTDDAPGAGPLGGILTALRVTGRDTLVIAWDMPFVVTATLAPLLADASEADVVVWSRGDNVEPLCALYRHTALPPLARAFSEGERSPRAALDRLRATLIADTSGANSPFISINSVQQLADVRLAMARAHR